ncbi:Uncharacterised protein [Candidatus Gugararchaeum adminiculabundum]|nr:Uncharacterised protein [Candidatus Gugararchaeum adminiculabundum]
MIILEREALETLNETVARVPHEKKIVILSGLDAKQIGDTLEIARREYRDELLNFMASVGFQFIIRPKHHLPDVIAKFEQFSEIYLESIRVFVSTLQYELELMKQSDNQRTQGKITELLNQLKILEDATDDGTKAKIERGEIPNTEIKNSFDSFYACEKLLLGIRKDYVRMLKKEHISVKSSKALQILKHSRLPLSTKMLQGYRGFSLKYTNQFKMAEMAFFVWSCVSATVNIGPHYLGMALAFAEGLVNNAGSWMMDKLSNRAYEFNFANSPAEARTEWKGLVRKETIVERITNWYETVEDNARTRRRSRPGYMKPSMRRELAREMRRMNGPGLFDFGIGAGEIAMLLILSPVILFGVCVGAISNEYDKYPKKEDETIEVQVEKLGCAMDLVEAKDCKKDLMPPSKKIASISGDTRLPDFEAIKRKPIDFERAAKTIAPVQRGQIQAGERPTIRR